MRNMGLCLYIMFLIFIETDIQIHYIGKFYLSTCKFCLIGSRMLKLLDEEFMSAKIVLLKLRQDSTW